METRCRSALLIQNLDTFRKAWGSSVVDLLLLHTTFTNIMNTFYHTLTDREDEISGLILVVS